MKKGVARHLQDFPGLFITIYDCNHDTSEPFNNPTDKIGHSFFKVSAWIWIGGSSNQRQACYQLSQKLRTELQEGT